MTKFIADREKEGNKESNSRDMGELRYSSVSIISCIQLIFRIICIISTSLSKPLDISEKPFVS